MSNGNNLKWDMAIGTALARSLRGKTTPVLQKELDKQLRDVESLYFNGRLDPSKLKDLLFRLVDRYKPPIADEYMDYVNRDPDHEVSRRILHWDAYFDKSPFQCKAVGDAPFDFKQIHNDFIVGKIHNIQDADKLLREKFAKQIAKAHVPDSTQVHAPVADKEAIWRGVLTANGASIWGKTTPEYAQKREEIKQQFLSGDIDAAQAEQMLKQAAIDNTGKVDTRREEQRAERAKLFDQVLRRTPFQFNKYPEDLKAELQKRLENIRGSVTTFVMQPDELYNAIPFLLNWVEGEMKKRFGEQPPEIPQQKSPEPVQQAPLQKQEPQPAAGRFAARFKNKAQQAVPEQPAAGRFAARFKILAQPATAQQAQPVQPEPQQPPAGRFAARFKKT